jgi:hypothetical protein
MLKLHKEFTKRYQSHGGCRKRTQVFEEEGVERRSFNNNYWIYLE